MKNYVKAYLIDIHYDGGLVSVDDMLAKSEAEARAYGEKIIQKLKEVHPDWSDFRITTSEVEIDEKDLKQLST